MSFLYMMSPRSENGEGSDSCSARSKVIGLLLVWQGTCPWKFVTFAWKQTILRKLIVIVYFAKVALDGRWHATELSTNQVSSMLIACVVLFVLLWWLIIILFWWWRQSQQQGLLNAFASRAYARVLVNSIVRLSTVWRLSFCLELGSKG